MHGAAGGDSADCGSKTRSLKLNVRPPPSNFRGESMNKGELIDAVAGRAGLSRADATKAVDGMLDAISATLSDGGSVSLVGFGTFSVKARAARMGRNPRTGEAIHIAASNVPGFKAGKGLKDAVN